jgi:predicted SnoaL-like aldol condensation-catalyzing enzyme
MKKIFITAIAGIICIITSCDNNSATTTDKGSGMREKNLAASDAISKAFQTGNEAAIDSFIADDFVDHSDRGDVKGKDSLKSMIRFIHANLKDMKTEKMHELADDDYVFSWMRWTGTANGVAGMPNGPYDMHAVEMSKFKDGKIVEHWTYMDPMEMMKMMGSQKPDMGQMEKKDTTKAK